MIKYYFLISAKECRFMNKIKHLFPFCDCCYRKQMSESIQKQKVHNFYQSVRCLPFDGSIKTTEQLNRSILLQSTNLYSLFDLIVWIANHQTFSERPLDYYRRLMVLIHSICRGYELYFSKIKALAGFWWQSSLQARSCLNQLTTFNLNSQVSIFRHKVIRDEYLFHTLRCFRIILTQINLDIRQRLRLNPRVRDFINKIVQTLGKEVVIHQHQTEHRIPFSFEYARLLLQLYYYRRQKSQTQNLFTEFFNSILSTLRVLKKFYNSVTQEHRACLTQLIHRGRHSFLDDIPPHKLNMLTYIIGYLDRNAQEKEALQVKAVWPEKHKKAIIIISRILNEWKKIPHLPSATTQKTKGTKQGKNIKVNSFEKGSSHKIRSSDKISVQSQKKQNKEEKPTFRKIIELKRKRFASANPHSKEQLRLSGYLQIDERFPDLETKGKNKRKRASSAQEWRKLATAEGVPINLMESRSNSPMGKWIPPKRNVKPMKLLLKL